MPVEKTSLSSASSALSPLEVPYTDPDRLTKLPPELLDAIFSFVPDEQRPAVPICKALLPFQRRRYDKLCLPYDIDSTHGKAVLAHASQLRHLVIDVSSDLPEALASLANPGQLEILEVVSTWSKRTSRAKHVSSVLDADAAPALSRLSRLNTLSLDCPIDLSSPAILAALRQTRLETLELNEQTADTVKAVSIFPLVSGSASIPSLKTLSLDFVFGEMGLPAEDCEVFLPQRFYESWVDPDWPEHFTRSDAEKLIEMAEKGKVTVNGRIIEAMEIEDTYEEEKAEFERSMRGYQRMRYGPGWMSDSEDEELDQDQDEDEEEDKDDED